MNLSVAVPKGIRRKNLGDRAFTVALLEYITLSQKSYDARLA